MRTYHQDGTLPVDSEVFVFGSNLLGLHAGGAAKVAQEKYGATSGRWIGAQGRSFAIPTADANGVPLTLREIEDGVSIFVNYAENHPRAKFFVTRVGCGIVGYEDRRIAPMFKYAPANCSLPEQWKEWVEWPV